MVYVRTVAFSVFFAGVHLTGIWCLAFFLSLIASQESLGLQLLFQQNNFTISIENDNIISKFYVFALFFNLLSSFVRFAIHI